MTKRRVAVLGAGSWGTALALALARNGHRVALWCRSPQHAAAMDESGENSRYLPGHRLPENLTVGAQLADALADCEALCVVVPSHAFATTLTAVHEIWSRDNVDPASIDIYWGTKGFDPGSGGLLDAVVSDVFGSGQPRAVVSGPSFAAEVALSKPTALTVAGNTSAIAERVASDLRSPTLRVYTNSDITGVQLGGAIKNVIAIATGVCDGLNMGANARAALLTRGLRELSRLGVAMGGQADTLAGLSGVGDLFLTCTDDQSRNRRVGLGLGRGHSLDAVLADVGQEAEGVNTAQILYEKSRRLGVDMPIVSAVYHVLFAGLAPHDAVASLLARQAGAE